MAKFENIVIDGENRAIAFNMKALLKFQQSSGKSLESLDDMMNDVDVLEELIYQGLVEGHRLAGQPMTIKKADVLAVSPDDFSKYTDAITTAFNAEPVKKKQGKSNPKPKK